MGPDDFKGFKHLSLSQLRIVLEHYKAVIGVFTLMIVLTALAIILFFFIDYVKVLVLLGLVLFILFIFIKIFDAQLFIALIKDYFRGIG